MAYSIYCSIGENLLVFIQKCSIYWVFGAKSNAYLFSISDFFFFNELKVNVNCVVMQVEDECKLSSVDEIATAVHQMLGRIQEEPMLN